MCRVWTAAVPAALVWTVLAGCPFLDLEDGRSCRIGPRIASAAEQVASETPLPDMLTVEDVPAPRPADLEHPYAGKSTWHAYEDRYAIIVMGVSVTWYLTTTR